MRIERAKNASRNIVFGTIYKAYNVIMPFVMRTAMIYFMGVKYLGLNSLFSSILQVLNLAELGVGSAMVFSMYKPIVEDDSTRICALMRLYKLYYRVIGLIIAVAGIAIMPFIPRLIHSDVPENINIYILYLLNLGATVISYWLFAYKNSLLQAHQRTDVISKVAISVLSLKYVLQFLVLWIFRNYYLYLICRIVCQAVQNIVTFIATSKMYPEYKVEGRLESKEIQRINQRIRDLFTSKLGSVVINSADTIVISAFLGLTVLAIYQNYYFILTAIIGFVTIFFNSLTAGIGNSLITETIEKNYNDFKKLTFLTCWIAGFCSCCLLNLYQPFMEIWVGKNLMLEFPAIVCFVIYYFVYEVNQLLNTYKDAGGIWHKDRFRPLVTATANLGMNLIMVHFWGIYGVLLSTVLSMILVGMPWLIQNLFSTMFSRDQLSGYLKKLAIYVVITIGVCFSTWFICNLVELGKWATFFVRLMICIILPNILFYVFYHKQAEFKEVVALLDRVTHNKLKLSQRLHVKG
ncbi:Membrane protein involved in the export of O-antigen and teichoic acid [Sarcina sp. DSM 11001]|uniref:lipopolysaccharide biosynthesis protein n=1 Tax=Sarcina sp. DSM 11001 TaxID=1798184 RepID=UPI00088AFE51|nr:polysaccharide biosynthesis protein [Sarcina sp. DSM 11001]SDM05894.1 Membrane protein involved in the export of O-antigen and teichoic acid [Sarcina sp. DSM 11001]